MPWLKQSDAAANHPIVLTAHELPDADDRILNELFGYVARCATQSAAFEQDYIVTLGTARHMAGSHSRFVALSSAAQRCGYWIETTIDGEGGERRQVFKLVEDNDLFHMILKAEREWTNQRKRDARDPKKTVPVRLRDGDACRYCGKTVSWTDRTSGRAGSYDHAVPGDEATIATYVVCCKECNGRRQNDPDRTWSTLQAPGEPLYGPETVKFLAKHGVTVTPSYERSPRKAESSAEVDEATAPSGPPATAAPSTRVETSPSEQSGPPAWAVETPGPVVDRQSADPQASAKSPAPNQAPGTDSQGAPDSDLPGPARTRLGQRSPGASRVGSGRDGIGQDSSGRDGTEAQLLPPPARRKRPRRRSRGKNTRPAQQAVNGEYLAALCDDHNEAMPCSRCKEE
ncbi:hypothetical protein [Arthrobacter sp. NPDC090010]|uniref:HNH endonuclease n=1 Tax=Arthrobacter sp. NPDC090010 TaxID=3363942 RepID=UPI003803C6CE